MPTKSSHNNWWQRQLRNSWGRLVTSCSLSVFSFHRCRNLCLVVVHRRFVLRKENIFFIDYFELTSTFLKIWSIFVFNWMKIIQAIIYETKSNEIVRNKTNFLLKKNKKKTISYPVNLKKSKNFYLPKIKLKCKFKMMPFVIWCSQVDNAIENGSAKNTTACEKHAAQAITTINL